MGMATTISKPPLMLPIMLIILNSIPFLSFSCPLHQKQALLHFKSTFTTILNSTYYGYSTPESWNPRSDCCTWEGVYCCFLIGPGICDTYHTSNVISLDIPFIVPEHENPVSVSSDVLSPLFQIQSLEYLDISGNNLEGEIPGDGFGNLTQLVFLRMVSNRFKGSIPIQLYQLTNLSYLDMSDNLLNGVLTPELGRLQNLEILRLYDNFLSGSIPEEIGNLTKLKEFHLMNNQFTGEMPSSITNIKDLEILVLSQNKFTGPIPSQMEKLSKLSFLSLRNNKQAGEIPVGLFQIKTLEKLFIGGIGSRLIWNNKAKIVPRCSLLSLSMPSCGVSGHIPEWISSQRHLQYLDLSGNQLEGRFPNWLAKMDAEAIILSDNKLTGSIPPCLFKSLTLRVLVLSRNKFSGELPQNIGNATGLIYLMLSGNNFSGQIPKSISNLYGLVLLDFSRNRISGDSFPAFPYGDNLAYIDWSYNNFSGSIPVTFPKEIRILSLGGNKFSGSLPQNITSLIHLKHLDLHNNKIIGDFQDVLPQIPTLEVLNLRNNSLEGFIPRTISNLTSLRILDLSGNNLRGSIPHEIAKLGKMIDTPDLLTQDGYAYFDKNYDGYEKSIDLEDLIVDWKNSLQGLSSRTLSIYSFLDLSNNRISGEIPASLGNLKDLKALNLSHNNIYGHIPASFGNLKSLESLDLSHNQISGSIPQSLEKLNELSILDVSNNKLTGKIPVGGQMNSINDLNFFMNNSGLCGMQIRIKCPNEDIPSAEGRDDEDVKQSWILWEGTWIGFPIGFFASFLMIVKSNFLGKSCSTSFIQPVIINLATRFAKCRESESPIESQQAIIT